MQRKLVYSIDYSQNGPTKKLIGKGRAEARAQAEARDCCFERSLIHTTFLEPLKSTIPFRKTPHCFKKT
jgi:hypothetical protein